MKKLVLLGGFFLAIGAICYNSSFIEYEGYEFDKSNYELCYVPDLNAHFYIDDIPDVIKDHLKKGIYWESGIGNLIAKYTKKGSIAVDIGSHIGIHTIRMSKKVGKRGQVIAFEPQKKNVCRAIRKFTS